MQKKIPYATLRSPALTAAYAHLSKPDTEGKYADGKFKVTLKLKKGDPAHDKFIADVRAAVKKIADAQRAEWKKPKLPVNDPVKDGDAKDDAEGSKGTAGFWLITAKSKKQPQMVDARRHPLPKTVQIFGGDTIKAMIALGPYKEPVQNKAGAAVYINGVQLLAKNAGGGNMSAEDMFDEEDGYEAPAETPGFEDESGAEGTDEEGGNGDFA